MARIDGEDIIIDNVAATCFGGAADPQDDGDTASGRNTKREPDIEGVSLAMDGRMFPRLSPAEHRALDGSPIPKLPWGTPVEITSNDGRSFTPRDGVIDLGPGIQATREDHDSHTVDLTVAAARLFNPRATATNFSMRCCVRIIGGAKFLV